MAKDQTDQIRIGGKEYEVTLAKTEEELSQGLKGVKELPKDCGMLFFLNSDSNKTLFTMSECLIPLDLIFINQDQEVVDVKQGNPGERSIYGVSEDQDDVISYVLEVNQNSGIKIGDDLEFAEDSDQPVMKVLFQDGTEQMALYGGERIFSRKNTKVLIRKAKKAAETKSDSDYKALGKYMFKCIKIQDERPAEYVDAPKQTQETDSNS